MAGTEPDSTVFYNQGWHPVGDQDTNSVTKPSAYNPFACQMHWGYGGSEVVREAN